jgi:hypothetical protein
LATAVCALAQEPAECDGGGDPSSAVESPALPASDAAGGLIPLQVPQGLPLRIALDEEVRIHEAGQKIHGKLIQPVYAFDRIVIPEGTEVTGQIARIEDVSKKNRTLSALDANFTPDHRLDLEFDEMILPDGKHLTVHTVVTPGSGQPLEYVKAKESTGLKSAAAQRVEIAKQQVKQTWDQAMKQVKEPGRMHRLERYLVAQLPVHPQYLDNGAVYTAELLEPLDFGTTPMTPKLAASLTRDPPAGSVVHALLVTPLSSATSQRDDEVEAMLWQPLFDGEDLILPAGSRLKGVVLQAHPAHKPHHNGDLRFVFHDLKPEEGKDQKVNALLVGVVVPKAEHVELDAEGGSQATSPNTRYLSTALAIGLAAASSTTDGDAHGGAGASGGNTSDRVAGGAGGFKLIGIAMGVFVHSQPLGMAMGALGASRSIYVNFLGPGAEMVYPKNTPMDISVGPEHEPPALKPAQPAAENQ